MDEEKRILFFVPYHEREDAKRLGAKWDSKAKKWWVQADGTDLRPFGRWRPVPRDYLPEVSLDSPRIAPDINPVGSLRALMPYSSSNYKPLRSGLRAEIATLCLFCKDEFSRKAVSFARVSPDA